MIKALLAGTKTQTIQILRADPEVLALPFRGVAQHEDIPRAQAFFGEGLGVGCPHGKVGDRLWVRETHAFVTCDKAEPGAFYGKERGITSDFSDWFKISFYADDGPIEHDPPNFRPSIHMRRWASRFTLEVTGILSKCVQDISDDDAEAEGVMFWAKDVFWPRCEKLGIAKPDRPKFLLQLLWEQTHGVGSWLRNPRVWITSFKPVQRG